MLEFYAIIYLFNEAEGGMDREGFSGMMPSFSVNNDLIMSKILMGSINSEIKRGQEYNVKIQLPYGENFSKYIYEGYEFNLNIGGKVIGKGKVIEIHK